MMGPDVFSFGPFRLAVGERLLTRDGAPVDLGARALDILVALVSRPNEPVGKRELMAEVWPDVTVEEGSLRFHIAGLRKALGDGQDGARYIATLPGRGYCFVAPVLRSVPPAQAAAASRAGRKLSAPAAASAVADVARKPRRVAGGTASDMIVPLLRDAPAEMGRCVRDPSAGSASALSRDRRVCRRLLHSAPAGG